MITCQRWIGIFHKTGDICLKRVTGNRYYGRKILCPTLNKLALYYIVVPKAIQVEWPTYLYNLNPTVDPYSNSQLHFTVELLGLTRKTASTTAKQAYTAANLTKRNFYLSKPPPIGVASVETRDIIDLNKAGYKTRRPTPISWGVCLCPQS